jgi:hypothetical protein
MTASRPWRLAVLGERSAAADVSRMLVGRLLPDSEAEAYWLALSELGENA